MNFPNGVWGLLVFVGLRVLCESPSTDFRDTAVYLPASGDLGIRKGPVLSAFLAVGRALFFGDFDDFIFVIRFQY